MRKPRKAWRQHYEVWLQAEGRDRDDKEYAAACLTCKNGTTGWLWLTQHAGDRKEAWEIAKGHEMHWHAVGE